MARPDAAAPSRTRSRDRADLLLALVAGVEMQFELFFADGSTEERLVARGLMLVLAVALGLRRRAPLAAVAIAMPVFISGELLPDGVADEVAGAFFSLLFLSYSLGSNADGLRLAVGVALMLATGAVSITLDGGGADDVLFLATIIVGGPVLLGRLVRDRARLARALRAKAAALEEDRAVRSAAAVSEERARIAGELHQMVSSALATMVDESDAAERRARTDPDAAAASLETIESTGREALGELRLLLGVLRREDDETALEPSRR